MGRVAPAWPVYVPTKGRAGRISRDVLSLSPTLVVEPAEAKEHGRRHRSAAQLVLPENEKGVSYARNRVLAAAQAEGHEWVWMLDDDLTDFFTTDEDGARLALPAPRALAEAEAQILALAPARIGAASLPTAWMKREGQAHTWNRSVYCCVALHVEALGGLAYCERLALKEDTDFSLRILSAGLATLRLDRFGFQMPVCGSHTGGLQATYARDREEEACAKELARRWPHLVRAIGEKAVVRWELFGGKEERGQVTTEHAVRSVKTTRFRPTARA
jgi:hypothetical protein